MRATMKVRILSVLAALALGAGMLTGCGDDDGEGTGVANPASVYCEEQGGEVLLDEGLCRLPDGTEIDEWDFYRQRETSDTTTGETVSPGETVTVEVYFSGESEDCDEVEPVTRTVEAPATVEAALAELLGGPTDDERDAGLGSWFSDETAGMLQSVEVTDGVAEVSFDVELRSVISGASSACGSANLLAQLDATVGQFDEVDRAVYALDGDVDAFYEWLQLSGPE